jgi:membrane protein required for colicin V production
MNLDFTLLDLLVVLAVILSTVYAAYRGFVNETLSIFAWAAAAVATLYLAPSIAPFLRARMSTPLVGSIIAYVGIFLAVLVPLSFISFRFSENVKNSPVGAVDRALGIVFGVVRGFVLVGLAYIVFSMFVPLPQQPHWVRGARLYPLIRGTSDTLLTLVPNHHHDMADNVPQPAAATPAPAPREAQKAHASKRGHKTYGADDRRALDNLIETTGSGDGKR